MATISGDNVTISGGDFINYKELILTRDGLTADSTDLTPTATDLTAGMSDPYTADYVIQIYNSSSDYKIELTTNTGFTMIPGPTDTIMPKSVKRYNIKILNQTTAQIFNLDHNGQPIATQKIITNTIVPADPVPQEVNIFNNVQNIVLGDGGTSVASDGSLTLQGNLFQFFSVADLTATSNLTYTAGQVISGYIKRHGGSSTRNDYLPTAADIVAAIPKAAIGTGFFCRVQNTNTSNKKINIKPNTGTTVSGSDISIERYETMTLLFVLENVSPGTEAVTAYIMGVLKDANSGAASLITTVTGNSYTVLDTDNTINVDYDYDSSSDEEDVDITLPEISTVSQKRYFITDIAGRADKNNIVIAPSGSDTIMGTDFFTINSNYGSVSMYNDETSNWVLY